MADLANWNRGPDEFGVPYITSTFDIARFNGVVLVNHPVMHRTVGYMAAIRECMVIENTPEGGAFSIRIDADRYLIWHLEGKKMWRELRRNNLKTDEIEQLYRSPDLHNPMLASMNDHNQRVNEARAKLEQFRTPKEFEAWCDSKENTEHRGMKYMVRSSIIYESQLINPFQLALDTFNKKEYAFCVKGAGEEQFDRFMSNYLERARQMCLSFETPEVFCA